jgi:glycosyltransferase involved in cell wall biosynthesis
MKKVLIITYYWPPAGGPGVQRVLKFAKYLPDLGWEPIILTVENGEFPAYDHTLSKEIPKNIKVYRTKTNDLLKKYKRFSGDKPEQAIPVGILSQKDLSFKKGIAKFIRLNFVIPDAKKSWVSSAVKIGKKIINDDNPDIIFSSSPPPSVHLIAKKLSQASNIKWIADLRDPWSKIHYYQNNRSALTNYLDRKLEYKTLSAADQVCTVSRHFGNLIEAEKNKLHVIPNGYDEEDFNENSPAAKDKLKFKIAYVGGLNENRFYPEFFKGLSDFIKIKNISNKDISFIIVGVVQDLYLDKIKNMIVDPDLIDIRGYVSHGEAINIMKTADVLLLFMEKVTNYSGHIPGKLFEYLAGGNYIIGVGAEEGDANKILKKVNAGIILNPEHDFSEILIQAYEKWKKGQLHGAKRNEIESFSGLSLTRELVNMFEKDK